MSLNRPVSGRWIGATLSAITVAIAVRLTAIDDRWVSYLLAGGDRIAMVAADRKMRLQDPAGVADAAPQATAGGDAQASIEPAPPSTAVEIAAPALDQDAPAVFSADRGKPVAVSILDAGMGSRGAISIGDNDSVLIAQGESDGRIRFTYCDDGACTTTHHAAAMNGSDAESLAIARGRDGRVRIAFRASRVSEGLATLRVLVCADAACGTLASEHEIDRPHGGVGYLGASSSIVLDANDWPVLAYRDNSTHAMKLARCRDTACAAQAAVTRIDEGVVAARTRVTLTADGHPLVAYELLATPDANTPPRPASRILKFAYCVDRDCSGEITRTIVARDVDGFALAIGSDSLPLIGYSVAGSLNVIQCAAADCSRMRSPRRLAAEAAGVFGLVIGKDAHPRLGYYLARPDDASHCPACRISHRPDSVVMLAICSASDCSGDVRVQRIDDAIDVGIGALALSAEGWPRLVYPRGDSAAGSVNLFRCIDPDCRPRAEGP